MRLVDFLLEASSLGVDVKPKDAAKAKSAGNMMQMAKKMGPGSYPGAKEALQHHSGKTLSTAMGSKKQSALSASVASIASGATGSAFARTGVFQMMAVHAQKGTLRDDSEAGGSSSTSHSGFSRFGF